MTRNRKFLSRNKEKKVCIFHGFGTNPYKVAEYLTISNKVYFPSMKYIFRILSFIFMFLEI